MRLYNAASCTPMGYQKPRPVRPTFLPSFVPKPSGTPLIRPRQDENIPPKLVPLMDHCSPVKQGDLLLSPSTDSTRQTDPVTPEYDPPKTPMNSVTAEDIFETLPAMRELDNLLREALVLADEKVRPEDNLSDTSSLTSVSLMLGSQDIGQANGPVSPLRPLHGASISIPRRPSFDVDKEIEWAKSLSDEIESLSERISRGDNSGPILGSEKSPVPSPDRAEPTPRGDIYAEARAKLRKTKTPETKIAETPPPPTQRGERTSSQHTLSASFHRRPPLSPRDATHLRLHAAERKGPFKRTSSDRLVVLEPGNSLLISPDKHSIFRLSAMNSPKNPVCFQNTRAAPQVFSHARASPFERRSGRKISSKLAIPAAIAQVVSQDTRDSVETRGDALSLEGERYSKYRKMLKLGIPLDAVKNAMQRDGLDQPVLDEQASHRRGAGVRDKKRRFRLHWDTHQDLRTNTIWAMAKRDSDVANLSVDEEEFAMLFQAEPQSEIQPILSQKSSEDGAVKVIDPKRANNGGIILARIRLSYREIARAIDCFDHEAMTQEQVNGILRFIPTSDEKRSLHHYLVDGHGSLASLCECEKFMVAVSKVKHAKRKLNAILFMQNFASSLEELRNDARLVQKSCEEVFGSSRFRKILGMILTLGNRLNTAGPTGKVQADAFTLDTLPKLKQAKTFDKKTTFLHYLVRTIRKNNKILLNVKDDMPTVFKAEKVQWKQLELEVERLEKDLDEVRKIALCSNVGGPGLMDDTQTLQTSTISLAQEVETLQETSVGRFTLDACLRLSTIVNEVTRAKSQFDGLLSYFGEEGTMDPDELFGIVATFCRDFDRCLEEVVAREKSRLKEARAASRVKPLASNVFDSERRADRKPLMPRLQHQPQHYHQHQHQPQHQQYQQPTLPLPAGSMGGVMAELKNRKKFRWPRLRM